MTLYWLSNFYEVLNISHNQIQSLPRSLFCLTKLNTLNAEDNRLCELPPAVGDFEQLVDLLLAGNLLSELPRELCRLKRLGCITLPLETIRFPPKGFLPEEQTSQKTTRDCSSDSKPSGKSTSSSVPSASHTDNAYEKRLEDQRKRTLEAERQLEESAQAQLELAYKATQSRQKVLGQLVEEEAKMHADIDALQRKRVRERNDFVSHLLDAEEAAADLIRQLIVANEDAKHREAAEERDNLRLLERPDPSFALRRQEILSAMENMLSVTDEAYSGWMAERDRINKSTLAAESSDPHHIQKTLANRYADQQRLSSEVALKEDAQKQAFAKLQAQQDSQARRLKREIGLVEQQLCRLTLAEQERKAKRTEVNQEGLSERRAELVNLLALLSKQQAQRQQELQARLAEMEQRKRDDELDFWLIQYQRLLDNKPSELCDKIDPEVHAILEAVDGLDFAPNFRYHRVDYSTLENMTDADLQRIGVYAVNVRHGIMRAVAGRAAGKMKKLNLSDQRLPEPTAPPLPKGSEESAPQIPSAPPAASNILARIESQCCVCQDAPSTVVFLLCGHVCCCTNCAVDLLLCPLCRGQITQRILLHF
ncbi:unnamed protein product [Calicophoron daubneyi]|uniref:RING-type domain-containing protein n=1 Tax=Calicophoron daubneyi TaxID=300641 RepID=A0AAV2SWX3_CALDB